jgi:hypothetical protein
MPCGELRGAVGRARVDDDDLLLEISLLCVEFAQQLLETRACIESRYNDRDLLSQYYGASPG